MPRNGQSSGRDIVVIGASAGGVEALGTLVAELDPDIPACFFVVLHIPATGTSVLPAILDRRGDLPAKHAVDGEAFEHGRIYVAPPDHHLLLQQEAIRVVRGPKENGYRPAIDPLFRTAALAFGPRVTGVVLSGVLDDGTAGLAVIKGHGGLTLVQDPKTALYPMMPSSAIDFVGPDRVLTPRDLGGAIDDGAHESVESIATDHTDPILEQGDEDFVLIDRAASDQPQNGAPSGFTCPECNGALWESDENGVPRFRCRTGHGFSAETLLSSQSTHVEAGLWSALRALEERAALTRRTAARFRTRGSRLTAQRFERQADEAVEQALVIRRALDELVPHLVAEPTGEAQ